MAITFAELTTGGDGANLASYSTASISPGANKLILCAISSNKSGAPDQPTVTGNGLTWVLAHTNAFDTSGTHQRTWLFRAMGASPTTGAITFTFPVAPVGVEWNVWEVDGIDTGGTDGSAAIVQTADSGATTGVPVTTRTATLAGAVSAGNAVWAVVMTQNAEDPSGDTGWTMGTHFTHAGPTRSVKSQYKVASDDNAATFSWTTASEAGVIIVEVKAAATGGGTHPLSGSSVGSSSATADTLTAQHPLGGESVGTSDGTADRLMVVHALSGDSIGTSDGTADRVVVSHALTGESAGTSAGAADRLVIVHALSGESLGTSSGLGDLAIVSAGATHPLSGESIGTSDAIADRLVAAHALAGASTGASDATADRLTVGHALFGESVGVSTASAGALLVAHALSGESLGLSDGVANPLSIAHILAGESLGTSSASGGLSLLEASRELIDSRRQLSACSAARSAEVFSATRSAPSYSAPRN